MRRAEGTTHSRQIPLLPFVFSKWFCGVNDCKNARFGIDLVLCHGCVSCPALWCARCCSSEELTSGLCRNCFAGAVKCCQYCWGPSGTCVPRWRPCSVAECSRWVFCCEACAQRCVNGRLLCLPCWRAAGSLCIECGETLAQTGHTHISALVRNVCRAAA